MLTDTVPGVLTVAAVTSSGTGACVTSGHAFVCGIDPLAAGATWTVTVQVDVPLGTPSGDRHEHRHGLGHGDTDLTNDSASQTTTIGELVGSADLTVAKIVDDASPAEGDTLTYVVTVTNGGPDDATGVEVTDVLPTGLTFVSSTASQGSYQAASGIWTVGSLAVGETAGLQIRGHGRRRHRGDDPHEPRARLGRRPGRSDAERRRRHGSRRRGGRQGEVRAVATAERRSRGSRARR